MGIAGNRPEVDPKLLGTLVCPLTKGPLVYDRVRQQLISPQAGRAYQIRDGIPIMLPDWADDAAIDTFAEKYPNNRQTEPSIMRAIMEALGEANSVVNVGAGTGSYEPSDVWVIAIDPSLAMISRRPSGSARAVVGLAEALPFAAKVFDAALAFMTIHHWKDWKQGLREMRRVATSRVLVLTWDQWATEQWWAPDRYWEGLKRVDRSRVVEANDVVNVLGRAEVFKLPIPHDCRDGFDLAYWRRPEELLKDDVLDSMSIFRDLEPQEREAGKHRLAQELADGTWMKLYGHLMQLSELDLGLQLVVVDV